MTEPIHDLLTPIALDEAAILSRGFYQRPTIEVARDLLGKILVRKTPNGVAAIRLAEVEAYLGIGDPACHTFGGRRTPRTETMWGEAGHAYVYLIYGIHSCLNVVTVGEGVPEAVLIRGGRIVTGSDLIRQRRGESVKSAVLTDGPGKLCRAMEITCAHDGTDFCDSGSRLSLRADGFRVSDEDVKRLPRVGIDYAGEAASWPLRLKLR